MHNETVATPAAAGFFAEVVGQLLARHRSKFKETCTGDLISPFNFHLLTKSLEVFTWQVK